MLANIRKVMMNVFEAFCHQCKKKTLYMEKDVKECMKKAWEDGWSPTCCLCCNCFRSYRLEE